LRDDQAATRRRLVSVLWTFAAGAAAGSAGLAVAEVELLAACMVGLAVAAATYAAVPSAVGQIGAWAAAVGTVCALVFEVGDQPNIAPYAVLTLAFGVGWAFLAQTSVLRERETGLALGASVAVLGAQLPVFSGDLQGLAYPLTALVAAAGFGAYLTTRSWQVLAAGVVATTLVVPEALYDWTDGSVSAAGSLLVAGLTLLAASAAGLRLRKEVG
jgi:hypothetical protein